MEEFAPFGTRLYCLMLSLLLFARGSDFISTWVATPRLVLEGNPIAKKLGWRWGTVVNLLLAFGFAFWPFTAIIISTISVLVAARNFQSAWLMRSLGEERYREWFIERLHETSPGLYVFCLLGHTILTAAVGAALIYFSALYMTLATDVPLAIGLGIMGYAFTVLFYTLLSVWRLRRTMG
jgi:hypothetical protein